MFTWIVRGKLAQSPFPSIYELETYIPRFFTGVISLTNWVETPPWLSQKIISHGLEHLHLPTPDHHPVELIDLFKAILFIKKHVERGGAVLVHCMGGIGRSGMVTTAYLISTGRNLYEALKLVRSNVPGSVENEWQHRMLENFEALMNSIGFDTISEYSNVLFSEIKEESKLRHVFKTIQIVIELYNWLKPNTSLFSEIKSAMLHTHNPQVSLKLREILEFNDESGILIDLAHALDYRFDSRVVTTSLVENNDKTVLLLCKDFCEDIVKEAEKYYVHIAKHVGKVKFSWDDFMNYA